MTDPLREIQLTHHSQVGPPHVRQPDPTAFSPWYGQAKRAGSYPNRDRVIEDRQPYGMIKAFGLEGTNYASWAEIQLIRESQHDYHCPKRTEPWDNCCDSPDISTIDEDLRAKFFTSVNLDQQPDDDDSPNAIQIPDERLGPWDNLAPTTGDDIIEFTIDPPTGEYEPHLPFPKGTKNWSDGFPPYNDTNEEGIQYIKPSAADQALAEWEREGWLSGEVLKYHYYVDDDGDLSLTIDEIRHVSKSNNLPRLRPEDISELVTWLIRHDRRNGNLPDPTLLKESRARAAKYKDELGPKWFRSVPPPKPAPLPFEDWDTTDPYRFENAALDDDYARINDEANEDHGYGGPRQSLNVDDSFWFDDNGELWREDFTTHYAPCPVHRYTANGVMPRHLNGHPWKQPLEEPDFTTG